MKFKKHIALFLAFFMLVSNIGFAMNVHYCGNKIAGVSLNIAAPSVEKSCCGVAKKDSSCCQNKVILLQKKTDQAVSKSFVFEFHDLVFPSQWTPVFSVVVVPAAQNNTTAYCFNPNAPPLYKLYSQYIFYDKV